MQKHKQDRKSDPKKNIPAKRKYVKKAAKRKQVGVQNVEQQPRLWIHEDTVMTGAPLNVQIAPPPKDEIDLLRDMLQAFEKMNDDSRFRAYGFFTNKHSQYDLSIADKKLLNHAQ